MKDFGIYRKTVALSTSAELREKCERCHNECVIGNDNRYVRRTELRYIENIEGHGLFYKAMGDEVLPAGSVLGEYTGELQISDLVEDKEYYWHLSDYPKFKEYGIDARYTGNAMRYVNHGCSGKENVKAYPVFYKELPRLFYVTTKDVSPGEQFLVDYGENYDWGEGGEKPLAK
jgi:SET domain-containing protein